MRRFPAAVLRRPSAASRPPATSPARAAVAALVAALVVAGCGSEAEPADRFVFGPTPTDTWAMLEDRLLTDDSLVIRFDVESAGAIDVALAGALEMVDRSRVFLTADGSFAGQPQALRLAADGNVLRIGDQPEPNTLPQPPGLAEALVIGFTRMGILHNLARLTGDAAPDHMEGGVREWVAVDSLYWGPMEAIDGRPTRSIEFIVTIGGVTVGNGLLHLDEATGLPVSRHQTVHFPQGDMNVVERYVFP